MLSIIVPVYNVEQYLLDCVNSLLNQSYRDLEIVLVDDGSTDSSGKICDQLALMDSRIKTIHKTNGGLSSSRNVGLDVAKGDYIAFVDSDDLVESTMFASLINIMQSYPQVDIVSCYFETFIDGTDEYKPFMLYYKEGVYSCKDYLKLILSHQVDNAVCNKLYRRECISNHRFIEGRINEDVLFNVSVLLHSEGIFYLRRPFYKYRLRKGSITQQANPKQFDYIKNAFEIRDMVLAQMGPTLNLHLDAYLYQEMVNFMAIIELYNSKVLYVKEYMYCKKYLLGHWSKCIMNRFWRKKSKMKLVVLLLMPSLYKILFKYVR